MNQRVDFIIPECYIDTNLVETLACYGGCNHQKGCNQVAKVMQEKFVDRFATKNVMSNKDFRFKRLFKAMEDVGEMKLLQKLISYLVNNKYMTSNTDLISIFQSNQ